MHPERGLVPPDEFIPLAEEIGLINDIGIWVLREACMAATKWPENHQCRREIFARSVQEQNPSGGCESPRLRCPVYHRVALELEITESVLITN